MPATEISKAAAAESALRESLSHLPPFRLQAEKRLLHFRRPARTSRGELIERPVILIRAQSGERESLGECSLMPGLSPEADTLDDAKLEAALRTVEAQQALRPEQFSSTPALRFGIEGALLGLLSPTAALWDTPFTRQEQDIDIHHLIWMDKVPAMLAAMREGARAGARCLKLKIGTLPLADELAMLRDIRAEFTDIEIRVDANGAFSPAVALPVLHELAAIGVACIEQPIAPGRRQDMSALCHCSPLPIALDEELIAATTRPEREQLLDLIHPQALVIKPSLHGGLSGAAQWARLADERGISWWINSALESHIGHSLLTQWCGLTAPERLHGLGTGKLFTDDALRDIELRGHRLHWKIYTGKPRASVV